MNFDAEVGDEVTLSSFKEADCAGDATEHVTEEVRAFRRRRREKIFVQYRTK